MSDVNYGAVRAAMGDKPYTMSLVGDDAKAVKAAVNQGIDSYLEACFSRCLGDNYEVNDRKVGDKIITRALDCVVSKESLPVLLRRLFETEGELEDAAHDLAGAIMDQLEVGDADHEQV